jgi:hypothetical protein
LAQCTGPHEPLSERDHGGGTDLRRSGGPGGKAARRTDTGRHGHSRRRLSGWILPFDDAAAGIYGTQVAAARQKGYAISIADRQIAAIALSRPGAMVATRNPMPFMALGADVLDYAAAFLVGSSAVTGGTIWSLGGMGLKCSGALGAIGPCS